QIFCFFSELRVGGNKACRSPRSPQSIPYSVQNSIYISLSVTNSASAPDRSSTHRPHVSNLRN
ncbi:hypothetical protein GBAR_LOCUS21024, partial [Geodia barretti]